MVLVPYVAVLGMRRARMERLRLPTGWVRWLVAAVHEEETELAGAIRPRRGTWRDAVAAAGALIAVVGASTVMEVAVTAVGRRYAVADIVTGGLVLAVVTSLPNAVSAVYLARRGRGAAVLSTALNSNAINVVAGLLIPAALAGLGPGSGQGTLVAAWYTGLTVLALALAYKGRGLGRPAGAAIIAGYLAFVTALVITVAQGAVGPAAAVFPAAAVAGAGALLLTWPARPRTAAGGTGGLWQRESVLPGWSIGRLWRLSLVLCGVVATFDAASGFAVVLGVVLGVPDQIFATITQYAFLAAVAAVGVTATVSAAVLQRQRP